MEVRVLTLCLALLPQLAVVMALAMIQANILAVLAVQVVEVVEMQPMLEVLEIRQAHRQVKVIMVETLLLD
jgi:hypothetical protein